MLDREGETQQPIDFKNTKIKGKATEMYGHQPTTSSTQWWKKEKGRKKELTKRGGETGLLLA